MTTLKPTAFPDWATSDVVDGTSGQNNVATPPGTYNTNGWGFNEVPSRQFFNWLGRFAGLWHRFHDELIGTEHYDVDGATRGTHKDIHADSVTSTNDVTTLADVVASGNALITGSAVVSTVVTSPRITLNPGPVDDSTVPYPVQITGAIGNGTKKFFNHRQHGHRNEGNYFKDHFRYMHFDGSPSIAAKFVNSCPYWTFEALNSGSLGPPNEYVTIEHEQGACDIAFHSRASKGIAMYQRDRANTSATGIYSVDASPFCAFECRFKSVSGGTPFGDYRFGLAVLSAAHTFDPSQDAHLMFDYHSASGSGKLDVEFQDTSGTNFGGTLTASLNDNTWFTVRAWTNDAKSIYFQLGNGTPLLVSAATNNIKSGAYCMFIEYVPGATTPQAQFMDYMAAGIPLQGDE